MEHKDPENWRESELRNRQEGFLNAADRCRERADYAEKHGKQMPELRGTVVPYWHNRDGERYEA